MSLIQEIILVKLSHLTLHILVYIYKTLSSRGGFKATTCVGEQKLP